MMMPNRVSVEVMNLWLDQVYQKRNLAWFARGMACTDHSLFGRLVGRGCLYHRWRERASKIEGYFRRGKIECPAVGPFLHRIKLACMPLWKDIMPGFVLTSRGAAACPAVRRFEGQVIHSPGTPPRSWRFA